MNTWPAVGGIGNDIEGQDEEPLIRQWLDKRRSIQVKKLI